MGKRYQSDLTDSQWAIINPLIPEEKEGGRPRTTDMREVMNAIFYSLRTGCQWDYLPKCFPPKSTVYDYFSQWWDDGVQGAAGAQADFVGDLSCSVLH